MPENGNQNILFVRYCLDEAVTDPHGGKTPVMALNNYLVAALAGQGWQVIFEHEPVVAGLELPNSDSIQKAAQFTLFVVSADFSVNSALSEAYDSLQMKDPAPHHAVLYFREFAIENIVAPLSPVFPAMDATVEGMIRHQPLASVLNAATKWIAELVAEIEPMETKAFSRVPQQKDKETLLSTLLELNYTDQTSEFSECLGRGAQSQAIALLAHGQMREMGAEWLVRRLILLMRNRGGSPWWCDARGADGLVGYEHHWILSALMDRLKFGQKASYSEILKLFVAFLKGRRQPHLVILKGVRDFLDGMEDAAFDRFLQEFWMPFNLELAELGTLPQDEPRLIMLFLADREMDHCSHFKSLAEAESMQSPLKIERVKNFTYDELNMWVVQKLPQLKAIAGVPVAFQSIAQRKQKLQSLLQASRDGWPELLLQNLCAEFGINFSDLLKMLPAHETPA